MPDTMSGFEMAVLAVHTRASLARLREFASYQAADEAALDRVDVLLQDFIHQGQPAPTASSDTVTPAPTETAEDRESREAFDLLKAAHPMASGMTALMWMGRSGDVHIFKHSNTRRSMAFNPVTKVVSCTLETGETSYDADVVLREITTL